MLAAFVWLTLASRRTWVLWAAACCLLLNLTHIAVLLDVRIAQWSYVTAVYVWGLSVIACVAAGVGFEGKRPAGPVLVGLSLIGPGLIGSAAIRSAARSTPSARARTRS